MQARVVALRVGSIAPLGPRRVPSGFVKHKVDGPVAVGELGLAGDAQADLSVHGGRDKAVYAYPAAAYGAWRAAVPHHAARLAPGAMGENLTIDGWSDADVAIGDTVRVGSAVLQVSEPRLPCFKLGLAFADPRMVKTFAAVGVSGWYYRVVEPGDLAAGDTAVRLARPNPAWTIARFFAAVTGSGLTADELAEVADLAGLADGWRAKARQQLGRPAAAPVGPAGFEPATKPL